MLEKIKLNGYWKLPEQADWQITGELTFSSVDGVKLNTIGKFEGQEHEAEFQYDIIHGFSTDGKKISLINCSGYYAKSMPGIIQSAIQAEYIIIGYYFNSISDMNFDSVSVHYSYLDEWVNIPGIGTSQIIDEKGGKSFSYLLKYTQPDLIELYTSKAKDILIWFSAIVPMTKGLTDTTISQKVFINFINKEIISFDKSMKEINHFRNFFAFGLSRVVIPTEIIGYLKPSNEDQIKISIIFKENYYPKHFKDFIFDYTTLFSFKHISGRVKEITANWLIKYEKLRPVFDRYFDCIYNPHIYPINYFQNLVFAIETYHRTISDETYFSDD